MPTLPILITRARSLGLTTITHLHVLDLLAKERSLTIKQLSAKTGLSDTSGTNIADTFERMRFLNHLDLTEEGAAAYETLTDP